MRKTSAPWPFFESQKLACQPGAITVKSNGSCATVGNGYSRFNDADLVMVSISHGGSRDPKECLCLSTPQDDLIIAITRGGADQSTSQSVAANKKSRTQEFMNMLALIHLRKCRLSSKPPTGNRTGAETIAS
jgi:hypothetical protein